MPGRKRCGFRCAGCAGWPAVQREAECQLTGQRFGGRSDAVQLWRLEPVTAEACWVPAAHREPHPATTDGTKENKRKLTPRLSARALPGCLARLSSRSPSRRCLPPSKGHPAHAPLHRRRRLLRRDDGLFTWRLGHAGRRGGSEGDRSQIGGKGASRWGGAGRGHRRRGLKRRGRGSYKRAAV